MQHQSPQCMRHQPGVKRGSDHVPLVLPANWQHWTAASCACCAGWRGITCSHALLQDRCPKWADDGECVTNAGWMNTNCRRSCNSCTNVQSFTQVSYDFCTRTWPVGVMHGASVQNCVSAHSRSTVVLMQKIVYCVLRLWACCGADAGRCFDSL